VQSSGSGLERTATVPRGHVLGRWVERMRAVRRRGLRPGVAALEAYLWAAPAILTAVFFLVGPWAYAVGLSLYDWKALESEAVSFVGFGNYVALARDPAFLHSLLVTFGFAAGSVTLQLVLGTWLAFQLYGVSESAARIYRVLFLIPAFLSPPVAGLVWRVLLQNELGLVNWALSALGAEPVGWLSDPRWALPVVVVVDVWQHTPFVMLLVGAALSAVPEDLVAAARVDGATETQLALRVLLPLLTPVLLLVAFLRSVLALRAFDVVYALFRSGGPGQSARTLGVYLFETLRVDWDLGRASAVAVALLALTLLASSWLAARAWRGEAVA